MAGDQNQDQKGQQPETLLTFGMTQRRSDSWEAEKGADGLGRPRGASSPVSFESSDCGLIHPSQLGQAFPRQPSRHAFPGNRLAAGLGLW